jgi:hypothetical protein
MTAFSSPIVRPATDRDAVTLARLAELDSTHPLTGDVLIAEEKGVAVAATSLADGRVIADPFRLTGPARAALRARAHALGAVVPSPSLRERIDALFQPFRLVATPR